MSRKKKLNESKHNEKAESLGHLPAAFKPESKTAQWNSGVRLIVNGQPFLMLAAELHNSSSSSLDYMEPIWPRLAAIPLNTVLTPLSWELVEPEEGKFDFTLLDGLLKQARAQHLKLLFLWLAAWKNGHVQLRSRMG